MKPLRARCSCIRWPRPSTTITCLGDYIPAILKGYNGIVTQLIKTNGTGKISLSQCCSVAGLGYGRDGSYDYYVREPVIDNDLKGVGPFILAGIEVQRLLGLPMQAEHESKPANVPSKIPSREEWAKLISCSWSWN